MESIECLHSINGMESLAWAGNKTVISQYRYIPLQTKYDTARE